MQFNLPAFSELGFDTVSTAIEMKRLETITGFTFDGTAKNSPPEEGAAPPEILRLTFGTIPEGITCDKTELSISPGWDITNSDDSISIFIPDSSRIVELRYRYDPVDTAEIEEGVEITLQTNTEKQLKINLKKGEHRLFLHPWFWGNGDEKNGTQTGSAVPLKITVRKPKSAFEITEVRPLDIKTGTDYRKSGADDLPVPIPGCPATVMEYPLALWRNPEYEVFSWNLFPNMLIFDTADYKIQADFLKRLAFFVEKKGYTGQILSDDQLEGKHGWNAHDYRAIDLASFFQAASDRRSRLNDKELLLRDILIENGIIAYDEDKRLYLPVGGGFISISRESTDYLRNLFLYHEGMHGIFFAVPEFRDASFEIWEGLSENQQTFWKSFFRWMTYNADNEYLVVNEVQAYLLQQPIEGVEYYFRNHRSVPLISGLPGAGPKITALLEETGTPFRDTAAAVRDALYKTTGLWHPRFYCIDFE